MIKFPTQQMRTFIRRLVLSLYALCAVIGMLTVILLTALYWTLEGGGNLTNRDYTSRHQACGTLSAGVQENLGSRQEFSNRFISSCPEEAGPELFSKAHSRETFRVFRATSSYFGGIGNEVV
ncbi:MAG: hypothetical protein ABJN40_05470 [Sneathiella sp.]